MSLRSVRCRSPLVVAVAMVLLAGCSQYAKPDVTSVVSASIRTTSLADHPTSSPTPISTATPTATLRPVDVEATLALLSTLPVKGRAPMTGYDRHEFGQAWSDDVDVEGGHNGCDTRNESFAVTWPTSL